MCYLGFWENIKYLWIAYKWNTFLKTEANILNYVNILVNWVFQYECILRFDKAPCPSIECESCAILLPFSLCFRNYIHLTTQTNFKHSICSYVLIWK